MLRGNISLSETVFLFIHEATRLESTKKNGREQTVDDKALTKLDGGLSLSFDGRKCNGFYQMIPILHVGFERGSEFISEE